MAICLLSCGDSGLADGVIGPVTPTLTFIEQNVFTPRCAVPGCHASGSAQQGLDLSEGQSHAHLVNVSSAELPGFLRVAPGRAADSYLVLKLTGDPRIVGDRMPLGGASLSAAELAAIIDWIDAGAAP